MSTTRRRSKKPRFYWAELGFLLLGLIGLRPEIITELLPTRNYNYAPYQSGQIQPLTGYASYYQPQTAYQQPAYQQQTYQQPVSYSHSPLYAQPAPLLANSPQTYAPQSYHNPSYSNPTPSNPSYYTASTYQQPQSRIANLPTTYPTNLTNQNSSTTNSTLTNPNYRPATGNTPPVVWPEGYAPSTLNPLYTQVPYQQNTYSPIGSGYNTNPNYPPNQSPYPLGRY